MLTIRAGTIARGGEVFVVGPGESMGILELAEAAIRLAGHIPGEDIAISEAQLRAGERNGVVRASVASYGFVPNSPILVNLMMEALCASETSALTRSTRRNIKENVILHSERRENLKSYIALTGWTLQWRRNVSPVRYELGFYIPEDGILHSQRRENLKSYSVTEK
jgi:hypothetical protein